MWSNRNVHLQIVRIQISIITLEKWLAASIKGEYAHILWTSNSTPLHTHHKCTHACSQKTCTGMFVVVLSQTENNPNVLQCCWSLLRSITAQNCSEVNFIGDIPQSIGNRSQRISISASCSVNSGKHYISNLHNTFLLVFLLSLSSIFPTPASWSQTPNKLLHSRFFLWRSALREAQTSMIPFIYGFKTSKTYLWWYKSEEWLG